MRQLNEKDISILENQHCIANDWSQVMIDDDLDLGKIRNVKFSGPLKIHKGVILENIPGGLSGYTIKENVTIINVASLEADGDSTFGIGTPVAVLDETGSRSVRIYPGISSQIATLMARDPEWIKKAQASLDEILRTRATSAEIGENAVIKNAGPILNVSVGKEIAIDGASRLKNGSIINNADPGKCFTFIGNGVEAENFIVEDAKVESKSILVNCYVGQGAVVSHAFSAHDSLFFSNNAMENGEAHSLLGGPYSVSMHKGTLIIGCQTSFLNAGSLTNQSNHMYKLGPVHWGLFERGVKTSSGSYLMLGAKIGAFSLLMGAHKTHPDSSEFPFSYLFADERGYTIVVPALMLRSCGLLRDEAKWPKRDKRLNMGLPLFDRISYKVLNPFTVENMLTAIDTIDRLLKQAAGDDMYMRYKGMKFTRGALERAKNLYTLAISKYLYDVLGDSGFPEKDDTPPSKWIDLGGQIMPRDYLQRAIDTYDINEAEKVFTQAFDDYDRLEKEWIGRRFGDDWRKKESSIKEMAAKYDAIVEEDRKDYLDMLSREAEMLAL